MNPIDRLTPIPSTDRGVPVRAGPIGATAALPAVRVLRNTYALLAMTLLFSATVAAVGATLQLPAPGMLLTLAGYFGLLFVVHKTRDSGWSLAAVFALTGFMGYTLGPVLARTLALPGG